MCFYELKKTNLPSSGVSTLKKINTSPYWIFLIVLLMGTISYASQEVEPNDQPPVITPPSMDPEKLKAQEAMKPLLEAIDSAMAKPLQERVVLLGNLERQIDEELQSGKYVGQAAILRLYHKYHLQLQQAKYVESQETYAFYIKNIKETENTQEAQSAFLRNLTRWKQKRDYAYCSSVCEKVAEKMADTPDLAAVAVYYKAYCKFRLNGTMNDCIALCQTLIADYPDSPYRPMAMKMLANAYMAKGSHGDALQVLSLLKQQYPKTHWEHYADMRPAIVWEIGKGSPQRALDIYTASLRRYPDHMYGPYIQKQLTRLQKIIEEQLIQDALEDIAKKNERSCKVNSVIVRSDSDTSDGLLSKF